MRFPSEHLTPTNTTLFSGPLDLPALTVAFAPFDVALPDGPIRFDTALRAEFIPLPSVDLTVLAGRTFDFPVNPQTGYIDASVYFMDIHNPVDITRLAFSSHGPAKVEITSRWVMTHERTGFDDFDLTVSVPVNGR